MKELVFSGPEYKSPFSPKNTPPLNLHKTKFCIVDILLTSGRIINKLVQLNLLYKKTIYIILYKRKFNMYVWGNFRNYCRLDLHAVLFHFVDYFSKKIKY